MDYGKIKLSDYSLEGDVGDLPQCLQGTLSYSDLADLSWVSPQLNLAGYGYWPVLTVDASAIASGLVASGVDMFTVNVDSKSITRHLGAKAP